MPVGFGIFDGGNFLVVGDFGAGVNVLFELAGGRDVPY